MPDQKVTHKIKLIELRVQNFRCLRLVSVGLDDMTVLVGQNNSGKTTLLDALALAVGMGRRTFSAEDIFLDRGETAVPKDRTLMVDILIRPVDLNDTLLDTFPAGSYWLNLWGNGVSQDAADHDYVAIRTLAKWDSTEGDYVLERRFMGEWLEDPDKLADAKLKNEVGFALIEPLGLFLMDAKRDIQEDMLSRGSFWQKLVSDLRLSDEQIESLENQLNKLNADIISASDVLRHVQTNIDDVGRALDADSGSVSITPTARSMRDLSRGMELTFAAKGSQAFPIARHGMGTRSLAAILTFRAYTLWRQEEKKGKAFHPLLGLEEPEAHLHPQAQRALFKMIMSFPGQRIISTHSPYIAAEAEISQFRYFRKDGPETRVTRIDVKSLSAEDIRRINRLVMNTRGDVLYAKALILSSGETEDQALPVFAEYFWNRSPNDLGVTFVGVGGDGLYLPFIRLAKGLSIPWFILSDGEESALKQLRAALEQVGEAWPCSRVFEIPDQKNFEAYLASDTYRDAIVRMIVDGEATNAKHKAAIEAKWAKMDDPLPNIIKYLELNKTRIAKKLAEAIISLADATVRVPERIRELLEAVTEECKLAAGTEK